jgi:hypothetical protein
VANSSTESETAEGKSKSRSKDKSDGTGALKLSNYLGILRDDAFDLEARSAVLALASERDAARLGEQPVRLLEHARQGHEARGEIAAVACLIEAEALLVADDAAFAASLWKELGRLRAENLLDAEGALAASSKS